MKVFVAGYPSSLGGADTELWHVMRLWNRFGVRVHLLPARRPDSTWRQRCDAFGFETTVIGGPGWERQLSDLPGGIVCGFCSNDFLAYAAAFRSLGCKLVWANCMTWMFPTELRLYGNIGPFDAYVFQSRFQQDTLSPRLQCWGAGPQTWFHIPGAIEAAEFPYRPLPHSAHSDFVVGRLARSDVDKWHEDMWSTLEAIDYRPMRARVMGWSPAIAKKLGHPPAWCETLPPCAESTILFYRQLHALLPINGGERENWPRIGLEAMAAGVPIVAHNAWGWREMIEHGETGFLANSPQEFAHWATELANNETLRLSVTHHARERLVNHLAEPGRIWSAWQRLFEHLLE